jgi:hypothetical protein
LTRRSFLKTTSAAGAAAAFAPAADLDWVKVEAETLDHFTALLKIDSSSPPGNETLVARYVQQVLERESIPAKFFAVEENRGNIVARLKGAGTKPPILLMGIRMWSEFSANDGQPTRSALSVSLDTFTDGVPRTIRTIWSPD